jgi:ribonuclease HI
MSKKKQKYYVVWQGFVPGIYETWEACQKQIVGYEGARFKAFEMLADAQIAFREPFTKHIGSAAKPRLSHNAKPIIPSICVDAACAGVPGPMEYRGVITDSRKELFRKGPYPDGTNNIGEFLAIVHALAYLKSCNADVPIYSDSITAIAWVRDKKCKTKHALSESNRPLFEVIERAVYWLQTNTYKNQILKWPTEEWGEIPADFGRK